MVNLFVYGSYLPNIKELARKHERDVTPRHIYGIYEWAILRGYARIWPKNLKYPFMIKAEGHEIDGVVYYNITEKYLKEIDYVEGHPSYYKRVKVKVITESGKEIEAHAYMGNAVVREHEWTWDDELSHIR